MTTSTIDTLHMLVEKHVKQGKTESEALAEICSAVDDMMASLGVVSGLEAMERGETTLLDESYIKKAKQRIATLSRA